MATSTPTVTEGSEEFTCFLSLGGPYEPGYVRIDSKKSEFLAFMSSGEKILHLPARDIQVVSDNWTLPSSVTVTSGEPPNKELVITHLLNKGRLVRVFKMMGKWQEDSESVETSPSPCTPNKDQSGMNEESLATVDLESPPESPKAKPHPVIPLPDQEPERLFPTPNETVTDPKLEQLHDMFPDEDIGKLADLLKVCGGDVTRAVDAALSTHVPDVPQERKFDCKEFFQKYEDEFLKRVNTHAIAGLLEIKKVIPGDLCFELERTGNDKATEMLYLHMRDHGSLETVHSLCDVMIGKEGFPMMNSLGQDMKKDLPILRYGQLEGGCAANKQRGLDPLKNVYLALHGAASSGNISEIESLVHKYRNNPGFNVDCLVHGCTPLHAAAKCGHVDVIAKLKELGCGMNKISDEGSTALHYAASNGHVDVIAKLFELGFDINKTNHEGVTALHFAAVLGHGDVVAKLVELGCDMSKTDNKGVMALHHAAMNGQVDVVAKLVELGFDMNKTTDDELTALHLAAGYGHVDVVAKLVELKCDISKTTGDGSTALHLAAGYGHVDVVAKLVELKCDVNATDLIKRTALHVAACKGHVKVVTKLIELGCTMAKAMTLCGATALHLAASEGYVDVVAELIRHGMNVNIAAERGFTALHIAAQEGHVNVVTKLVDLGCDKNKTNSMGQTALDIANAKGHTDIVAKLIC